jgi:hypothetical protein
MVPSPLIIGFYYAVGFPKLILDHPVKKKEIEITITINDFTTYISNSIYYLYNKTLKFLTFSIKCFTIDLAQLSCVIVPPNWVPIDDLS